MKLMLVLNDSGRLIMAEHCSSGLLVFRHDGEEEAAFLKRVREQLKPFIAGAS